jgi:adenylylsulfate reductase, subunit B
MMPRIDPNKCVGCGNCTEVCPFGVLEIENGKAVVKHPENCRRCGACVSACPNHAIDIGD